MSHARIKEAIQSYSAAYLTMQDLQDTMPWIPGGDQKTGSIGEYYAFVYLMSLYNENHLSFGKHSEKGWDISISTPDHESKVQVKTVSAFSKTRTISPIHKGWDQLFIIYLERTFLPTGFWITNDQSIFGSNEILTSKKCRHPDRAGTGSTIIPWGVNRIAELTTALSQLPPNK